MIFFAKSQRSVYFRSWNGCSTTPCIQWCFSRCFSSCSDENLSQMKSWCTQEGYKCITLAVGVQEGILFCRYFFCSRSQLIRGGHRRQLAVSLFGNMIWYGMIWIWMRNTDDHQRVSVSDDKIQITILILRRGPCLMCHSYQSEVDTKFWDFWQLNHVSYRKFF